MQTKTNQNKYNAKLGLNNGIKTNKLVTFFCIIVFVFFWYFFFFPPIKFTMKPTLTMYKHKYKHNTVVK